MKLLIKIVAAPIMLLLVLVSAFCAFILAVTEILFWLLSVLVFIGTVVLFFSSQTAGGIAFLLIAFLISPYGFPALAAWLVSKLDSVKYFLQEFIAS